MMLSIKVYQCINIPILTMIIRKLSEQNYPSKEELDKIRSIPDEEIDFSDAPETDKEFWSKETRVSPKKYLNRYSQN